MNIVVNIVWLKVNVESLDGEYGNIGLKFWGVVEILRNLDLENIKFDL